MKIETKLFLCTVLLLAISFNIGSSIFIKSNFEYSLKLHQSNGINEYYTQRYLLESQIITHKSNRIIINDRYIASVAKEIEGTGVWKDKFIQLQHNGNSVFYTGPKIDVTTFNSKAEEFIYGIIPWEDEKYFIISSTIEMENVTISFTQGVAFTELFRERDRQIASMSVISIIIIGMSAILLFSFTRVLTKNIGQLATATKEIAQGNYFQLVEIQGNDEVTTLSKGFNVMALSIMKSIDELDNYAKSRDTFVTNFSHVLKTPMT